MKQPRAANYVRLFVGCRRAVSSERSRKAAAPLQQSTGHGKPRHSHNPMVPSYRDRIVGHIPTTHVRVINFSSYFQTYGIILQVEWNIVVREIPCRDPSSPAAPPQPPYLCRGLLVTVTQQKEDPDDKTLHTAQLEVTIDQAKSMLLVTEVCIRLCPRACWNDLNRARELLWRRPSAPTIPCVCVCVCVCV